MVAPGAGAGNQSAARAAIKSAMPAMHQALSAFPVGSKEYKAVMRAISSLLPVFGSSEGQSQVPAAIAQQAAAAKSGGRLASAPPVGLAESPPPGAAPEMGADSLAA